MADLFPPAPAAVRTSPELYHFVAAPVVCQHPVQCGRKNGAGKKAFGWSTGTMNSNHLLCHPTLGDSGYTDRQSWDRHETQPSGMGHESLPPFLHWTSRHVHSKSCWLTDGSRVGDTTGAQGKGKGMTEQGLTNSFSLESKLVLRGPVNIKWRKGSKSSRPGADIQILFSFQPAHLSAL